MTDNVLSYCPGCGHGTAHRILAEVLQEADLQETTVGVSPVGCSVLMYNFMNIDMQQAAHGRAPAVATAIKRLMPDKFVFTYQGDGDLAAIGTAETIHACNRGENILDHLCQQWHLWYDWRTDGANYTSRDEIINITHGRDVSNNG
jgi:2-oxoglutarate/2-oxoacid ferredoxin oxidoreductase subunit beta